MDSETEKEVQSAMKGVHAGACFKHWEQGHAACSKCLIADDCKKATQEKLERDTSSAPVEKETKAPAKKKGGVKKKSIQKPSSPTTVLIDELRGAFHVAKKVASEKVITFTFVEEEGKTDTLFTLKVAKGSRKLQLITSDKKMNFAARTSAEDAKKLASQIVGSIG